MRKQDKNTFLINKQVFLITVSLSLVLVAVFCKLLTQVRVTNVAIRNFAFSIQIICTTICCRFVFLHTKCWFSAKHDVR